MSEDLSKTTGERALSVALCSASSCACALWARTDGKLTNHHPNCPHYNDSLIVVWRFRNADGTSYVTDREPTCAELIEASESEITVSREEMHREVYDHLGEFAGF